MKFIVGNQTSNKKPLKLDADTLADTRALICASSGGGKSRLLRLIAEQVADKIQTILIDPEGEFPSLREKLDILIVGENGDVQANVKSAALLARRLAETGVSAVLDIYDLPGKGDPWDKRRAFVAEFLNALMNLPKSSNHPMLIIVDEAHQFAPEAKAGESANASRSAINSLMSAGRKRGFGGILATQRISKITKDAIADARNIFIGGTTLGNDQERAGDMLGMNKRDAVALRDLAPGEFYCFGPATGSREIFRFISGDISTTHPKAGQRANVQVPKASTKIKTISEKLGDLPQEAQTEIENMDVLKRENMRLQRDLAARPTVEIPKPEIKEVKVPVIIEEQIGEIITLIEDVNGTIQRLEENARVYSGIFTEPTTDLLKSVESLRDSLAQTRVINQHRVSVGVDRSNGKDRTAFVNVKQEAGKVVVLNGGAVTNPEQRVLDSLAWYKSTGQFTPEKKAIAAMAGYAFSGTFTEILGSLVKKGLIEYTVPKTASLTVAGNMVANHPNKSLTVQDVLSNVKDNISNPEWRVLEQVIDVYPGTITKQDIAMACGYKFSGTFTEILGDLKKKGLIDYPKPKFVKAAPFLFLE